MSKLRLLTVPALAAGLLLAWSALGLARARQDEEKEQPKAKAAKAGEDDATVAARVKEIFRVRCFECHGGPSGVGGGVKILDRENLIKRKKVKPKNPDDSPLYQSIVAKPGEGIMPKEGNPPCTREEIDLVRRWIVAGAPDFPKDAPPPPEEKKDIAFKEVAGVDHVFKAILNDVRKTRRQDRIFVRYFSINHIAVAGSTETQLQEHRDAFVKAINHMSWEPSLCKPRMIDPPYNTVFALDIRELGWDKQPYRVWDGKRDVGKSDINLYDLVLLEYPYAIFYEDSETYDHLLEEYVLPSYMARPIPYVRADWFVSVITQPPLYEDMLMMPTTVKELEDLLGIDRRGNYRSYKARRAGMTVSGVSRNNRVVERHPMRSGHYWVSFDFKSSKGDENMFKDPLNFRESGGEFVFSLPNGLNGYYVADAKGDRLDAAPTDIVTDEFAADKTVRNGLACMRCHDQGIKSFEDKVRPALERLPGTPGFDRRTALEFYAKHDEMEKWLKEDTERFMTSLHRTLGKDQKVEPLRGVSKRFLDMPLGLDRTAGELGLTESAGLTNLFRMPAFSTLGLVPLATKGGVIRRDAWEDYYDSVVRGMGLGKPMVPLDGLNRLDYPAGRPPIKVELKTNRKGNVFVPGDKAIITVNNLSPKTIYIELIGTSTRGRKTILTNGVIAVPAGKPYRFPPTGDGLVIQPDTGKEQITLLASATPFQPAKLLRGQTVQYRYVTDRVYHPFYAVRMRDGRPILTNDAGSMVKKTIEIETK